MVIPSSPIPRKFYRAAFQRLEEANVLFEGAYYHATVYLAGYAVECALKSLILAAVPIKEQPAIEKEFRGQRAHSFEWLRERYRSLGCPEFPREIVRSLSFLRTWETALRYEPGKGRRNDAKRFLGEAQNLLSWVDRRL